MIGDVRVIRRLPLPGQVLVQQGQLVESDDVVAETRLIPGQPTIVDLALSLGIPRESGWVDQVMLRREGDRVAAGDPLAAMRLPDGQTQVVSSPATGTVELVSRTQAFVLIREDARPPGPHAVARVARDLGIWPSMIRHAVKVRAGSIVRQGAVIATANGPEGVRTSHAPADGVVESIDLDAGMVIVRRASLVTQVTAFLSGRVEEVLPGEGVVIAAEADVIAGAFAVGGEGVGQLEVLVDAPDVSAAPEQIGRHLEGAIVVLGAHATRGMLDRCSWVGIRGVIVGGIDQADLVRFVAHEFTPQSAGREATPFPILLTGGFGPAPIWPDVFDRLLAYRGRKVALVGGAGFGGNIAPRQLIIPLGSPRSGRGLGDEPSQPAASPLEPDPRLVRLVAPPYLGLVGELVDGSGAAPVEEVRPSGIRVPVVAVRLKDGRQVTVPEVHLEPVPSGQPA